jgi:outer membrane immunogenic protein
MRALRSFSFAVTLAAATFPAAAADIPIEPIYQARPVVLLFRWTGVYAGVHLGAGAGRTDENAVPFVFAGSTIAPLPTSLDRSGWLAGGQIGANYQIDSWVLGFEAQASWASFQDSSACTATALPAAAVTGSASCTAKIDALGTVAARLGWAFDRLLLYGKGGAAWTNDNYEVLIATPGSSLLFSGNITRWGWMAGIGVEYAFTDNWTAKIEYNYMDLGNYALHFAEANRNVFLDINTRERLSVVKLGINYRIGVSPILIR